LETTGQIPSLISQMLYDVIGINHVFFLHLNTKFIKNPVAI